MSINNIEKLVCGFLIAAIIVTGLTAFVSTSSSLYGTQKATASSTCELWRVVWDTAAARPLPDRTSKPIRFTKSYGQHVRWPYIGKIGSDGKGYFWVSNPSAPQTDWGWMPAAALVYAGRSC